jgi:TonB family protein
VLLLIAGAVSVVLILIGISVFRAKTPQTPTAAALPQAASEAVPTASGPTESRPAEAKPVEPEVPAQLAAPSSPNQEVIPDVPRSALETIRGTIRVSVRVVVAKDGTVVGAITEVPGPSRYFERLALEAAKKWTFGAASSDQQRVMLLMFDFRRAGVTARAKAR